jgi:rRNA maturation protein Nop10
MTLVKKCPKCKSYTLKENCPKDNSKTIDAHYKFKKIRDAPKIFKK